MSPHPVLLLLGPTPWEGPFVAGLAHPSSRVAIERRCLDTADLPAGAESGLGRVAVVGADAPRVDADVVARLRGDDVEPVRAALDRLVARGLLSSAEKNPTPTYRPARGHEDFNV